MKNTDIIKDKLNILDVVGSYVKLEKAGKTYKGKSPFTNEKTPSFFVSPEKGFFYCFSSNKGGDIFDFIQEIERITFKEALTLLAEKAGVDISQNVSAPSVIDIYYKILDDATKWYEIQLRKQKSIVQHLMERGLSKETLVSFRIGYAPEEWSQCYRYLQGRKYSDKDIEAVGLIKKNESGTYYDRFRNRIMFPLFDARGRVVGFSGRIVDKENKETKEAKYINSPEGPLFDKSKVLYGYHTAKTDIAKQGYCVLVEGQFDVLLSQQSGYVNTVAISGTGLSPEHIVQIKRFTDTLYIALDADVAGIKATRRSVLVAYQHGMHVRVVVLPEGMDPADTIVHSKEQWDICVRDAQDYIDYRLDISHRAEDSFEERKALIDNDIFAFVLRIPSAIVQDTVLQKISLFLGVSVDAVRSDFDSFADNTQHVPSELIDSTKGNKIETKILPTQQEVLYLYAFLQDEQIQWDSEIEQQQNELYKELYNASLQDDIQTLDETKKNIHLFIYKERYKDTPTSLLGRKILISLREEKIKNLEEQSQKILKNIRQAELEKNTIKIHELQHERQKLLQLKDALTKE